MDSQTRGMEEGSAWCTFQIRCSWPQYVDGGCWNSRPSCDTSQVLVTAARHHCPSPYAASTIRGPWRDLRAITRGSSPRFSACSPFCCFLRGPTLWRRTARISRAILFDTASCTCRALRSAVSAFAIIRSQCGVKPSTVPHPTDARGFGSASVAASSSVWTTLTQTGAGQT